MIAIEWSTSNGVLAALNWMDWRWHHACETVKKIAGTSPSNQYHHWGILWPISEKGRWSMKLQIEKPLLSPNRCNSDLIILRPRVWKVDTLSPRVCALGINCATRSFISRAALLVNVTEAIVWALWPHCWIRYAILLVITRVLPLPAPASTSKGLSMCSTACCWRRFKSGNVSILSGLVKGGLKQTF